jgi:hypothetical protein
MSWQGGGGGSPTTQAGVPEVEKLRRARAENWVVPGKLRRGFHANLGGFKPQKRMTISP